MTSSQPRFSNTPVYTSCGGFSGVSSSPRRPIESPTHFCTRPPFRLPRPDASYPSTCCLLDDREIAEAPNDPGTCEHAHVSPRGRSALRTAEEARGNGISNHSGPRLKIIQPWRPQLQSFGLYRRTNHVISLQPSYLASLVGAACSPDVARLCRVGRCRKSTNAAPDLERTFELPRQRFHRSTDLLSLCEQSGS
jgi:hypothetical protein